MLVRIIYLSAVLLIAGCATRVELQDTIFYLEECLNTQTVKFQKELEAVRAENKHFRARQKESEKKLTSRENVLSHQSASHTVQYNRLKEELQTLNGKLDETEHRLKQSMRKFNRTTQNNDRRISGLESYLNTDEPVFVSNPDSTIEPALKNRSMAEPQSRDKPNLKEQELYKMAKEKFDQRDYRGAREGFQTMMRTYPDSTKADNAQFWLGEIYYREKAYKKAILAYQDVIEKYPHGNKIRAAILKQGFAFINLDDEIHARSLLKELIKKYPGSREASIAAKRLKAFK